MRTFVLVYETGSATAAADELDVTQPSVSYALAKMRRACADQLFVRQGQRMVPTPLADDLYPRIRHALEVVQAAIGGTVTFDPATSTRAFRLMMTEIGIAGLLAPLAAAVRAQAPGVSIEVQSLDLDVMVESLRTGRLDACICVPRLDDPAIVRRTLFQHDYVGICAPDHPRIGAHPTLAQFAAEEQVVMTPQAGYEAVAQTLIDLGIEPRIAFRLPTFSGVAAVVATSECVGFAPKLAAQRVARSRQVRIFTLPFQPPPTDVSLYTPAPGIQGPAGAWFADVVHRTLAAP